MNTQEFADLLVLGMPDTEVIGAIQAHTDFAVFDNCAINLEVAQVLITALDNMYGANSYQKYKETGWLPSEQ